jgi:hypothetical protein
MAVRRRKSHLLHGASRALAIAHLHQVLDDLILLLVEAADVSPTPGEACFTDIDLLQQKQDWAKSSMFM